MLSSRLPGSHNSPVNPSSNAPPRGTRLTSTNSATEQARISASEARSTAVSALNNPRFGQMLDQIMNPQASGMVAFLKADEAKGGSTDFRSAASAYSDNG